MADLEQFKFITYYSTQIRHDLAYPEVNIKDHTFNKIITKYSDNSDAKIECDNCKLEAVIFKISNNTFKINIRNPSDFSKVKLSCNEIIIKRLLE